MCWCAVKKLLTHSLLNMVSVVAGVCVPRGCTILLVIRDVSSPAEAKVYMTLEGTQYPLGLLPGTTVHFDTLQRKTSMNGLTYFAFTVASSCHIVSLANSNERVTPHDRFWYSCIFWHCHHYYCYKTRNFGTSGYWIISVPLIPAFLLAELVRILFVIFATRYFCNRAEKQVTTYLLKCNRVA